MIKEGEVVYTDKYEIPVWRKYTLSVIPHFIYIQIMLYSVELKAA